MRLGEGFYIPVAEPQVEHVHVPTADDIRNEQLLVAIAALQDALLNMPRPEVHVEAPDLTAIVQAVTALKPGATSEDIAGAVVRQLSPATPQTEVSEVLGKLVSALERLDFRMQGSGSGGAAGLVIGDNPARDLGRVTVKNVERPADATTAGTVQAVNSSVMLVTAGSVSSFSFDITGFTTGTFVIERTLAPDPTSGSALWTAVGAFRAGTRTSRSTWVDSPGAYHGNASASSAVRIRVSSTLSAPATVNLLASSGTGTITVGAIASNEGNIIGAIADLPQHYATTAGGNMSWNASIDVLSQATTGEQLVAALVNPVGSGVDMFIDGYELNASGTSTWRRYRNATLSSLGTAQDNVNRGGDTAKVAAGRLYRGAGSQTQTATAQFARTGGTLGKAGFIAANNVKVVKLAGGVRLRPGQNWVFTATGPGGLGGTYLVTFFADWWELPAS